MTDEIQVVFETLLELLKSAKGDERTPRARALAVTATILEKALAYYAFYVRDGNAK
jgi:hypothetical protein